MHFNKGWSQTCVHSKYIRKHWTLQATSMGNYHHFPPLSFLFLTNHHPLPSLTCHLDHPCCSTQVQRASTYDDLRYLSSFQSYLSLLILYTLSFINSKSMVITTCPRTTTSVDSSRKRGKMGKRGEVAGVRCWTVYISQRHLTTSTITFNRSSLLPFVNDIT